MKQQLLIATLTMLMVTARLSTVADAASTCPSVAPVCTGSSSSTLSHFSGTFSCTSVQQSSGNINVATVLLTADGAGNFVMKQATNSNQPESSTFSDFSSGGGTYCVNEDNVSGYIFPNPAAGGCPLALGIAASGTTVRLIGSAENKVETVSCRSD